MHFSGEWIMEFFLKFSLFRDKYSLSNKYYTDSWSELLKDIVS